MIKYFNFGGNETADTIYYMYDRSNFLDIVLMLGDLNRTSYNLTMYNVIYKYRC